MHCKSSYTVSIHWCVIRIYVSQRHFDLNQWDTNKGNIPSCDVIVSPWLIRLCEYEKWSCWKKMSGNKIPLKTGLSFPSWDWSARTALMKSTLTWARQIWDAVTAMCWIKEVSWCRLWETVSAPVELGIPLLKMESWTEEKWLRIVKNWCRSTPCSNSLTITNTCENALFVFLGELVTRKNHNVDKSSVLWSLRNWNRFSDVITDCLRK